MKGEELIINFEDDKAYLSDEKVLNFEQIEMPDIVKRFRSPAAWIIKVIAYNPDKKRIFAEITSYNVGKLPFPYCQLNLKELNEISKISFKHVNTLGLLSTLKDRKEVPLGKQIPRPKTYKINKTFFIPFKKIQFKSGIVSFDKRVAQLYQTLEFSIPNAAIRKEFDAIKNYFAKVLQTKKIQVDVTIQLTDRKITNIEAQSPEIARIGPTLIDNVRIEFIKSFTQKNSKDVINKTLFTLDEFFDTLTKEEIKSNIFYDNDNQFLEDLIQVTDTKHYKHLRFLSSKHAHSIIKLRFVLNPFSFVFLIEGKDNYHFIWETLDTEEATYVWHESKAPKGERPQLDKIQSTINTIKAQGKTVYINTTSDNYSRVYHDYSQMIDGFLKWKVELQRILT